MPRSVKPIRQISDGDPNYLPRSPFLSHLKELRSRLIKYLIALLLCSAAAYVFSDRLLIFLAKPLIETFAMVGSAPTLEFIYTTLPEGFLIHLKIAFYGGLMLSAPFLGWQVWQFVAPALYRRERGVILAYLWTSPLLFLLGATLVYIYIMPNAWAFFLSYSIVDIDTLPLRLLPSVSEYVTLSLQFIFAFGLTFQLPLILILLGQFHVLKARSLAKSRKYVIVGLLILAAILTPPDIISQIGLAIPLIALYEISIGVIKVMEHKRKRST